MKKSLATRLTVIYLILLIAVIGISILIVDVFLPRYYLAINETKLIHSYEDINEAISNDTFEKEQFETDLEKEYQTWNISAFIIGDNGEHFFSNNSFEGTLKGSLIDNIFGDSIEEIRDIAPQSPEIIKKPEELLENIETQDNQDTTDSEESQNSDTNQGTDAYESTDEIQKSENKQNSEGVQKGTDSTGATKDTETNQKPIDSASTDNTINPGELLNPNNAKDIGETTNAQAFEDEIIKETDDYVLQKVWDERTGSYYLEMWGNLENGWDFILRTPLDGITQSAELAYRFMIYVGILAAIVGFIAIFICIRRTSKPIRELSELSVKMAELDFDEKYAGTRTDEIGILGDNFNKMSESLENTISELKAANMRLEKDLENKNRLEEMRSEFIGNVSHELKTPIALIQSYAEGLKSGIADNEEERNYYCEIISDEARKMNHLVMNLLSLNELEFGDSMLDIQRFDICELINGISYSITAKAPDKNVEVECTIPDSQFVWGDEYKIEEVLSNYLSNALNHVEPGETGKNIITVSLGLHDKKARIEVFNTGKQIPEEDLERIWDKFYKVDKAHTREYGGNGIGLSIVKAIMEAHSQRYGVENTETGVVFWFELETC